MLIINRKAFAIGSMLTLGFLVALIVIFSPLFGQGMNGLEYADDVFNKLSKGSSYFIPKLARTGEGMIGRHVNVEIRLASQDQAQRSKTLLAAAGMAVQDDRTRLLVAGDLGQLLRLALDDADAGYRNDNATLQERHGMAAREVLATWWYLLHAIDKVLKQEHRLAEAKAAHEVMKKAIEPAYNYHGIDARTVGEMAGTMGTLLVFYVLYTIWWGSAIYFLFEGVGLIMRRT